MYHRSNHTLIFVAWDGQTSVDTAKPTCALYKTRLMILKKHVGTATTLNLYYVALCLCFSQQCCRLLSLSCILIFSSSESYLYLLLGAL